MLGGQQVQISLGENVDQPLHFFISFSFVFIYALYDSFIVQMQVGDEQRRRDKGIQWARRGHQCMIW